MTVGVVVVAYGSPRSLDDLPTYYTHIRGGRPPSPEQLDQVRSRYEAIGGSPLRQRTEAQAAALEAALGGHEDVRMEVAVSVGYKHSEPLVEQAVADVLSRGAERIVVVPMTPHHTEATIGGYFDRARQAAEGCDVVTTGSWHLENALVRFLSAEVRERLAGMPPATKVLFTAHSLPLRAVDGDAYPDLVAQTAGAVAAEAGLDPWSGWAVAWQSAGLTGDSWLGPDMLATIAQLAETGRAGGVLVCPCGFVSDHLEVLYDLDIEARRVAEASGLRFDRTAVVNDDPAVMEALARRVRAAAGAPTATVDG